MTDSFNNAFSKLSDLQAETTGPSMAVETRPLSNKRTEGVVGSDLTVTFITDMCECRPLHEKERFTQSGSFMANVFLVFNTPSFLSSYANLLSAHTEEQVGLPLVLSMFGQVSDAGIRENWEGQWFKITARVHPYKLPFQRTVLDGIEEETGQLVMQKASVVLPHDYSLEPIEPRLMNSDPRFSSRDNSFPITPASVSFCGPIDLTTYKLKPDPQWPEAQKKTCGFIRLGTYLIPEDDRLPKKGVHPFHVFVFLPLNDKPWSSKCSWVKKPTNQGVFTSNTWMYGTGIIAGVLNRDLLQGFPEDDTDTVILVVIPDTWETITASAVTGKGPDSDVLSSRSVPSTPSKPTPSKQTPTKGIISRNPFSSQSAKAGLAQCLTPSPVSATTRTSNEKSIIEVLDNTPIPLNLGGSSETDLAKSASTVDAEDEESHDKDDRPPVKRLAEDRLGDDLKTRSGPARKKKKF